MANSEEWECAEKKSLLGTYMPVICHYTHEPWKLRNETVLHKEQIKPDLAEPHKKLRISTNYYGSQRVFNCKVFPVFLFLFSSWRFLTLSCNAECLTWRWGQSLKADAVPHCSLANPFSLMEAQSNDCCNSWHIHSGGTESLHTDFWRNTMGISAPCSGLSTFWWLQVKIKKRVCVGREYHILQ